MGRKDRRRRQRPAKKAAVAGQGLDPGAALTAALAHHQAGRIAQAERIYEQILAAQPNNADALHLLGVAAHQTGRHDRAITFIEKAVRHASANPHYLNNLGEAYRAHARVGEAVGCYRRALEIDPGLAGAHNNLGNALSEQGDVAGAVACFRRALEIDADDARTHCTLGDALRKEGDPGEAIACYRRALEIDPGLAEAHNNLGNALSEQGDFDDAVACYRRALQIDPNLARTLGNLGNALRQQDDPAGAVACYRRALEIDPGDAQTHANLGDALSEQENPEAAIACYRRALEIDPGLAAVHNKLGRALWKQERLDEAIACYRRALKINPNLAEAHNRLGIALKEQGKLDEAMACYRRALEIDPDSANVHNNLGDALSQQGQLDGAIASYRRAVAIKPDFATATTALLRQLQEVCAWDEFNTLEPNANALLQASIERGKVAGETPFNNVGRCADPPQNFAVARSWSRDIARRMSTLKIHFPVDDRRSRRPKITIGYLSSDFCNHAVAHLIVSVFGLHNKKKFKIIAYSLGLNDESDYRKQIERDCDKFDDIRGLTPADAAKHIYEDRVDILVDLNGYTEGGGLEICALRPAAIGVTYLGFPGTTGADFIDYIITDKIVTPGNHAGYYSEKLVYLPHCYQVNDHTQRIADQEFTRADCGLPEDAFVFCCFNRTCKIESVMFGTWIKLLKKIPGSVLWLFESNGLAKPNLKRQAEARGVDADQIIFAAKLPNDQYLARLKLADLVLDTRIYNGHTTTSDALWAGVPVITLKGSHFASRVSASILTAVGLPDLVTHSLEEYAALATRLAQDPGELSALRRRLAENRATEPLFDTPRFVKNLENAYKQMWDIFLTRAKPRLIEVVEGR